MYGLLKEHGPFIADVDKNGHPFVRHNPYRWSAHHNVLYVDNPVGTGFSFTDDSSAYPKFVEESTDDLYELLQQFFTLFPEYQSSHFFPFGESYAGKYVPTLAFKIHNENIASIKPANRPENWLKINLGNRRNINLISTQFSLNFSRNGYWKWLDEPGGSGKVCFISIFPWPD